MKWFISPVAELYINFISKMVTKPARCTVRKIPVLDEMVRAA